MHQWKTRDTYLLDISRVEKGPDPTRAYFWPAINKRPKPSLTRVLFDSIQGFFYPKGKNGKIWGFREKNSKPKLKMADPTQLWSKNFDPDPLLFPGLFWLGIWRTIDSLKKNPVFFIHLVNWIQLDGHCLLKIFLFFPKKRFFI